MTSQGYDSCDFMQKYNVIWRSKGRAGYPSMPVLMCLCICILLFSCFAEISKQTKRFLDKEHFKKIIFVS